MKTEDLHVLVKIAELQSITAAANQLDMSTSATSTALKRIEQDLGAQMFVRTTRQLRLTSEGERFIPLCQQALELLQQGQVLISEDQASINGEIRIAMSSEMGRNLMRLLLNQFIEKYPDITLRLHVSDSRADFYRDGVDVALRAMTKVDSQGSNLYGFKICNIAHTLCAAPSYIDKFGQPENLDELTLHNALLYKLYDVVNDSWDFVDGSEKIKIKMRSNRAVNDGDIVRRWCIDGVGIAKKSAIDVGEDLLAGRLQRIMTEVQIPLTEMWLMLPSRQLITPAIRQLRDELKLSINDLRERLIAKGIFSETEWPPAEVN